MFTGSTDNTINEMRLVLESSADTARYRTLLTIFWGLIFAKCFVLEYAVQLYSVPINSVVYVWTLSLSMAAVVTAFHLRARRFNPLDLHATAPRLNQRVWLGACITGLILAVSSVTFEIFSPFYLPGIFAVILGLGFFLHSALSQKRVFAIAAVGWWAVAIPLLATADRVNLLWFGLAIIVLQVAPATIIWTRAKAEARQMSQP